jgi:ABC-type glycerol-3-phosphate transport system substrate-binding protein
MTSGAVLAAPMLMRSAYAQSGFDWKQQSGKTINVGMSRHPWQEAIEPMIPEFEALTGITVKLSKLPEQQYLTKTVADLTGGTFSQDVFMTQYYDSPSYQQKGWTKDIGPLLDNAKLTDKATYDWEDFFPAARDVAKIGGKYSDRIAITSEAQTLIYRADVLKEKGLEVPKTFADLTAAAAKISEGGNMFGMTMRGGAANWWPFYGFVKSFGGDYVTRDLKPVINSKESKAALESYVKLASFCPPGITNSDWDEINTAMLSGQAAMFLDSSVIYSRLQDKEASTVVGKVGVAPMVAGPAGPHGQAHFWTISLADKAAEPEAGWLFMQWATSKDIQGKIALKGVLGPRSSAWEVDGLSKVFPDEFLKAVQTSLKTAVISPANLKFFELMDPLRAQVQEAILGNASASDSLDKVQAAWEKILA